MISPNDTDTACVESWRHWCETNGVDFIWNKQIISKYMNSYDKIGIVGSKTMIKWDAENIFDKFDEDDFCGVLDTINFKRIYDEVKGYENFDISKYINTDILFFGKKYIDIFEKLDIPINQYLQKNNIQVKELTQNWNLGGIVQRHFLSHNWQLKEDETPFFIKFGDIWNLGDIEDVNLINNIWESVRSMYQ